jgi:RimJ/RimL family protein N-acetyltransferase
MTWIDGVGTVRITSVAADHPRPESASLWGDWGPIDPTAHDLEVERWLIEIEDDSGRVTAIGDLSAHAVWYGPTAGSRAVNIGISIVEGCRGRGVGSVAQRLLAEALHQRGVVRVEASTDVENVAEQRSLARAGFVLEGTLRLAQARRDGWHDLQVWSHVRAPSPEGSRVAGGR